MIEEQSALSFLETRFTDSLQSGAGVASSSDSSAGASASSSSKATKASLQEEDDDAPSSKSTVDVSGSPVLGAIAGLLGATNSKGVPTNRFLMLSSPVDGKVSFLMLPQGRITFPLVGKESGLVSPHGLAVDKPRQLLYIADSGKRCVWVCGLLVNGGYLLSDKLLRVAAEGVEARHIAVNPQGDLFIADETKDALLRLTHDEMLLGIRVPSPVYSGAADKVKAPYGLWADSIFLSWTNSEGGPFAVSRAPHEVSRTSADKFITVVAANITGASAVVGDGPDLFFTSSSRSLGSTHGAVYKVKRAGGEVLVLNDRLTKPTGIDTDGTGNIYVADEGQDAVFRVPSAEWDHLAKLDKVIDFPRVFAVTYFELPKTESAAHTHTPHLEMLIAGLVGVLALL